MGEAPCIRLGRLKINGSAMWNLNEVTDIKYKVKKLKAER